MMKKITCLFTSLILYLCCSTTSFAQGITCEGELELLSSSLDKVSVDKIKVNKEGSFTLYAFSQLQDPRPENIAGYLPALWVCQLNDKLQLKQKVVESFDPDHPYAPAKKAGAASGGSAKVVGRSFQEMVKIHSEFFHDRNKAESFSYSPGNLMREPVILRKGIQYDYNPWSNTFTEIVNQESIPIETPNYETGSLYIHDEIRINQQAEVLSMVLSNYQDVENANQLLFLNQTIVNCKLDGEQLSRYHLSFEYPAEVRFHQFIQDQKGNSKGVLYIFGPARRFGFKMTDPDPHNYQIVGMNNKGERIFDHKFRYGIGGGASEPLYAATIDEQVFVLGKGLGKNPNFHLMIFDATGLKETILIDPDLMYSKTAGDYGLSIRQEHYSSFHPKGFAVQEDGGILFYGEHKSKVSNARVDPSTREKIPAVYEYPAYAFLQFDQEGNFLKNFVVEKDPDCDVLKSAEMELLHAESGKVHFLATETHEEEQPLQNYQKFYTAGKGGMVNKNFVENVKTSALLTLDLQDGLVNELRIEGDFVNIEGPDHKIFDPVSKELLLVGRPMAPEFPFKVLFKKIKL